MPIFESHFPEIIAQPTVSTDTEVFKEFCGSLFFTVDGNTTEGDAGNMTEDRVALLPILQPIWGATDRDFRQLHELSPDATTSHTLSLRNNKSGSKLLREEFEIGIPKTRRPGMVHRDSMQKDDPGKTTRYTYHTHTSTEFFIGHRWYAPFSQYIDYPEEAQLRSRAVIRGIVSTIGNWPFLKVQSTRALVFQPEPGSIARIDGQIHRKPRRTFDRLGNEKYIQDQVSIVR